MSLACCACIKQSDVGVVESWGRFKQLAPPGCVCLTPCKDTVNGRVSLRLREQKVGIETKTKDNVFVFLKIDLQYQVMHTAVETAHYTLTNPHGQIEAYVHDSVRAIFPKYTLGEAYIMRQEIGRDVKKDVDARMEQFGYDVHNVLLVGIEPAHSVNEAMNSIHLYEMLHVATRDRAETEKLVLVKKAEGECESMRLSGMGLSQQRQAIVAGLATSIGSFREANDGLEGEEVLSLLLINQYYDVLRDVAGAVGEQASLVLTHGAGLDEIAAMMAEPVLGKQPRKGGMVRRGNAGTAEMT